MKRVLCILSILFVGVALADPAPLPQAFDIRLDQKQLATIEQALVKMPYEEAAPILENLSKQLHDQAQAATKPKEEQK